MNIPGWLDRVLKAGGIIPVSVSIGNQNDKTTWKVQPDTLQPTAQPIIDAFDVNDPAHVLADVDTTTDGRLREGSDHERLALAESLPDAVAAISAGTYNAREWSERIRRRVISLRRAVNVRPKL